MNAAAPDKGHARSMKDNVSSQCQRAAEAIAAADVLFLVTGAGFSADSGLATYTDVARVRAYMELGLDYMDICQPQWLYADPALFYGFWGQCYNDYRQTAPHEGYGTIARWKESITERRGDGEIATEIRRRIQEKAQADDDTIDGDRVPFLVESGTAGIFFSFTSNVDAHFYDTFPAHEIHECHGNVELWQCTDNRCSSGIWRAPLDHRFVVDPQTMMAPSDTSHIDQITSHRSSTDQEDGTSAPRIGHTAGIPQRLNLLRNMPPGLDTRGWLKPESGSENWPRCGHCNALARPAILMFGDGDWKYDAAQEHRWNLWRESVLDLCQSLQMDTAKTLKVCVLEIGCGLNVPTGRYTAECMVSDVLQRGGHGMLIRINRDFPLCQDPDIPSSNVISILSTGLAAIQKIDEYLAEM